MSEPLFRQDAYLREAAGRVTGLSEEGGVILDATVFYPTSGGQPGDSGMLEWEDRVDHQQRSAHAGAGEGARFAALVRARPCASPPNPAQALHEAGATRALEDTGVRGAEQGAQAAGV